MYQNIHKECWSVFMDLLDLTLKINSHSAKAHYHHWQQNSKEICINKQKNDVRKCTKQLNSCHAVLWLYAKSFCLQKQYGSQKKQTGEFLCAESIWQPKKNPGKTLTAVHLIRLINTVVKTIANQRGIYTLMLKNTCKLGSTVTFSCRKGKDVTTTKHNTCTNIIQKEFAWPKLLFYHLQFSFTKCVIMAQGRQFKNMFGS